MAHCRLRELQTSRTLCLVDIENLAGRPTGPTDSDVRTIADVLYRAFSHNELHLVVACAHRNARSVWFNWPEARRLVRSGPDGADLCLLGVLAEENVENRFDTVVIASGDGIFAKEANRLAADGVRVVAAIGRGLMSQTLRRAVSVVVRLPLDVPTGRACVQQDREVA